MVDQRFSYFGYGSNLSTASLRAKGVTPLAAEVATLRGWTMAFDVRHWFRHEGGVANVHPTGNQDDLVQGVRYECSPEDMDRLDAVEAYGVGYDRITVDVETTAGLKPALTYVGMPGYLDSDSMPTAR